MATQPMPDKSVSVEEYLSTVYEHDCEYVDGVVEERDSGECEHSFLQLFLGSIFVAHRNEWGVIAVSEQRIHLRPTKSWVPDLAILKAGTPTTASSAFSMSGASTPTPACPIAEPIRASNSSVREN